MKPALATLLLLLFSICTYAQAPASAYEQEILDYQQELNNEYRDPEKSPLEPEDLQNFNGLPFFPINEKYRVEAQLVRSKKNKPIKMPTSTARIALYQKWADAHFELDGKKMVLPIYQSLDLRNKAGYEDYLFLPFKDLTNGKESYGGGRYISLRIPEGDTIIIDFNKAYNPYCAYSSRYSCPIPPKENRIPLPIPAGVMASEPQH